MKIPVEIFLGVEGSMTSQDGQSFMLRAKCEDGSNLMLGLPHREIPNIVECAAMQMNPACGRPAPAWLGDIHRDTTIYPMTAMR